MKKARRTLPVLVLATAAISVAIVTGWLVHAQEAPPAPATGGDSGDTQAMIAAKEAEAIRLAGEGQQEAAAALYQEISMLIRRLMMELPESSAVLDAMDVKARIEGLSPAQLELLKAREREAAAILSEARRRMAIRQERESALPLIAQVETQYADTSAAFSALAAKGEVLVLLRRFDEAYGVYTELLNRVEPVAPGSTLVLTAKSRGAFALVHRVEALCDRAQAAGRNRTPDLLANARADCDRVVSLGASQRLTVRARALMVEIELLDMRPDQAELLGETFLTRDYADAEALRKYPEWILELHLGVAEAARIQGKTDKALQFNDRVKQLYSGLPQGHRENANIRKQLERAYFQSFLTLSLSHAQRKQLMATGREVLARFPDSRAADYVRRRLGLPATRPAS